MAAMDTAPAAAALVAGLVWVMIISGIPGSEYRWFSCALTLFAGLSMVVQIPFWSFKEINVRRKVPFFAMILLVLGLLIVALEPSLVLFLYFLGYSLSGYVMFGCRGLLSHAMIKLLTR